MEPIAIIGFSFRLPQGAEDEASFWEMLESGRNVMTEWPKSRANIGALYNGQPRANNTLLSRGAHFIDGDPGAFDAPFFSVTTKDAASMDPQQRWTLEAAYRAMENSGIPAEKIAGTDTAVFAASMADDWTMITYKDPDEAPTNTATSTSPSILANRLSWYFDFRGPSIQVNTACSSSMIATDLAVQCLRNGQSSMALVTGSNPLLTPEKSAYLENMSFLSPDSRCYSFDHRANGYARGEGVAVLVLKRLGDAVRDGDMIRAVIRASGSNQDGHTPGITQPSLGAQEELIRKVYKSCHLDFKLTRYVEAHGTGTQLGDSTETKALGRVFRTSRSPKEPLYIGSVKANIGHTEGVSGLAGILKSILILEKGQIPPNALFEKWNPKINAKFNNLKVPTSCIPWPTSGLRRISVNSFGFGGSNGHVILDDAFHTIEALALKALTNTSASSLILQPLGQSAANGVTNAPTNGHKDATAFTGIGAQEAYGYDENSNFEVKPFFYETLGDAHAGTVLNNGSRTVPEGNKTPAENGRSPGAAHLHSEPSASQNFRLLVWSAKDEAALARVLQDYSTYYEEKESNSDNLLDTLAYTLSARRSLMAWRSFSVVSDTTASDARKLVFSKGARTSREGGLAMVFTGQGAQYVNMGLALLIYPVFEAILLSVSDVFRKLGADWLLLDEIRSSKRIESPQISQPLCTALQIALFELLQHFGVTPNAVVGHSSGEIAAAYATGALSLESACKVAFHRGRLAQRLVTSVTQSGGMMSVNVSEADIDAYLQRVGLGSEITVACINSPQNVTLSGNDTALNELQKYLEEDEIFARKLNTGVAYHSPAMKEISDEYLCSLDALGGRATEGGILMVSSVTGQKISSNILSRGQYWVDNLVSPVQFADALQYLALAAPKADGLKTVSNYVEIGPHAALKRPIISTVGEATRAKDFKYLSVLSKFEPPMKTILDVVGQLFVQGYPVSVNAANQQAADTHKAMFLVDTPQYPFNHSQAHWQESRISRSWRFREAVPRSILGMRVTDWNPLEPRWRKILNIPEMSWLEDHVIGENMLFPATGSLTMALEAVRQMAYSHQTIAGYRVKEAVFMKPIVVRPDQDTEVLTHLRPLQQPYEKTALRFEVKLFTVEDDYWSECFKSTIHIEYEEPPNQVDGTQESHLAAQLVAREFEDAKEKTINAINETDFYKHHRRQGLTYGEAFSIARGISWDGDELAVAQVDVGPPLESCDGLVHPAVFDAACQVCYVAPSRGMSRELPTTIPHKIRDAWISASGWQYPSTRIIRVLTHSKLKPIGSGIESSVKILSDNGSLLCHFEQFELLPITSNVPSHDTAKKLFHRVDWQPKLSLLNKNQLQRHCSDSHTAADDTPTIGSEVRDLDMLLLSIAYHNMDQLLSTDWSKAPAYMERYVSLIVNRVRQLQDQGINIVSWEASLGILSELVDNQSSWKMFLEIAKNYASIVRGEIDATELIVSSGLMHAFYDGLTGAFFNSGLRSFLQLAVHQSPGLRILEIGAGSGFMTNLVLSILEQIEEDTQGVAFCEYVFTDKSGSRFDLSRQRFSKHENRMIFKTLDFEQDLDSQGFKTADFDLVLAGDLLHATKDVSAVLQNLRGILKATGNLIFLEHTVRDSFALNFGFGILPNWWSSEDKSRASVPLLTESEWDIMLLENGFSGNDLVVKDSESHDAHKASIIVSSVIQPPQIPSEEQRVLLVTDGEDDFQNDVASCISDSRHWSIIVPMTRLEDTAINPSDCVIFLADLSNSLVSEMSESTFNLLKDLIRRAENILWVASSDTGTTPNSRPFSGIKDGFLRTLRSEFNKKRIVALSLDGMCRVAGECASKVSFVFESAFSNASMDVEYVVRDGQILTGRLVEDQILNHKLSSSIRPEKSISTWLPGPPLKLDVGSRGQLETMHFKEDIEYYQHLGPLDVEIDAKAWAVNFRDVFSALGRLDEPELGSDCAGIVTRVGSRCKSISPGDRVVMCRIDCMRMYPRGQEQAVVKIPPSVSFEEACAIINPGMTAWHCLVDLARLAKGEKVLIHGASGATGQLSIQLAQRIGAEVFVTVGYQNKKKLLMDLYGIPADHIFYSRSINTTFAKAIKRMTNGYGVDVVVNSLVGEGLRASWECIAPYGRFIEIGKTDINTNSSLPMLPFAKNAMFASVDIRHLLMNRAEVALELLRKTMAEAEQGTLHYPKPLNIYDVGSVEDAFRYIQSGKNSGRVVIRIDPASEVQKCLITHRDWKANDNASYLVVGGFGGVGRSILRWMAAKGARNLIVPTRSDVLSAAAVHIMSELRAQGITVTTHECDVVSQSALSQSLEKWSKTLPPIRGCINAAMVLNDAVFENMSSAQWNSTIHSKVSASWNLHSFMTDLDWMILLSSVSGVIGNPGQANYAAGCTFQDSLAQYRSRQGQRTVSIDLGVMRNIGVVAESELLKNHLSDGSRGLGQVEEEELLALLDICCDPEESTTTISSQVIMGLRTPVEFLTQSLEVPEIMDRPLFAHFSQLATSVNSSEGNASGDNLALLYRQAATAEERAKVAAQSLARKLARALAIEADDVDMEKPLHAFGVDSLVAVELRNWIAKEFAADIPVFEIMGGRTVEGVGELVEKSSQIGKLS
ncbi:hypothetical protein G7054_g5162 [Neopestalotiopsis clavispora]|nr:hypothetical protein G7054_g5162 [Neopestalotiopsis clavispora]